ncbi:hypothetical protein GCM10025787_01540 [Saccharopolyspora rosea]
MNSLCVAERWAGSSGVRCGRSGRPSAGTAVLAAAVGIGATIAWGGLTDRVGRRPVYLWVTLFGAVWAIPMFLLVNTASLVAIVITVGISYAVCQNALAGAQGAWFPELFQARTRSSGASLAYQISAMISGATPFVTTLMFMWLGWLGPAVLFLVFSALGLLSILLTRETWGHRERAAALRTTEHAHGPAPSRAG